MFLNKFTSLSVLTLCLVTSSAFAQAGHEGMNMGGGAASTPSAESAYMKETMDGMNAMHKDMMDMSSTNGVPDHDFLVMMIPHHKGALSMAQTYLKYGKNAKVKKLAQEIIVAQKKEIAQMEKWIKEGVGAKK